MRQEGSFEPLNAETRNVLARRLSSSINEAERHAVRCLIFTEHDDNGGSLLWCAYGSKLKVFNVTTWICDPVHILFPSSITCMCLDARDKLWVGCIDGQLYVVDTITRICGEPLGSIEGKDGCQSIAFDPEHNHVLTASRHGFLILWNASNWQRLNDMNFYQIYDQWAAEQPTTFKSQATVTLRRTAGPAAMIQNDNRKKAVYNDADNFTSSADAPSENTLRNTHCQSDPLSLSCRYTGADGSR